MTQKASSGRIEKPAIVTTQPVFTASLRARVRASEMRAQMGRIFNELSTELKKQGVLPSGPWFIHHFQTPGEYFDFEVCFPVATVIGRNGNVAPGLWPGMKMIRTTYHGPYEGLAAGWIQFRSEIERLGVAVTPEIWEVYRVGPEAEASPEKWETELFCAVG
jgi:effector-binding domain-containing protein